MAVAARTRLFRHPGRVAVVVIALVVVVNLAFVLGHNTDTTPASSSRGGLPATIESISPQRGELTGLIDDITVDLDDSYTGVLIVDRREIPEDQLDRVEQLGVISFRPGPGKELPRLIAGENTVVVLYWLRTDPRPAKPFSFSWSFRAAA
jgi:hypothetical protein